MSAGTSRNWTTASRRAAAATPRWPPFHVRRAKPRHHETLCGEAPTAWDAVAGSAAAIQRRGGPAAEGLCSACANLDATEGPSRRTCTSCGSSVA